VADRDNIRSNSFFIAGQLDMSALASLILFVFIAVISMAAVAYANYKVDGAKLVRQRLQKFRNRAEELEDIVMALDQMTENRGIPKLINDEVIEIYEEMIALDLKAGYLQAGLSNAKIRSEELSNESATRHTSRLCNSDAQIARLQAYLKEASSIVRKQHAIGKITTTELQEYVDELDWLHLQVYVVSNIVQGHKAYSRQDVLTANAFYKKAQAELMRSGHPDERRHKMIKQLADILFGRRKSIDSELMPEDEFNPDNFSDAPQTPKTLLSEQDQEALQKIMDSNQDDDLANMPDPMVLQNASKSGSSHATRH
jgi:hypothetical protein